jgi:hypothetical protein
VRELRKDPRVRPLEGSPVRVDIMGDGFLVVLVARDISAGGVGVFVPHDFQGCDIDSEVELILKVGGARPFKTRGVIRHQVRVGSSHFYGVAFVGLSPEQREIVSQYVDACLRGGRKVP